MIRSGLTISDYSPNISQSTIKTSNHDLKTYLEARIHHSGNNDKIDDAYRMLVETKITHYFQNNQEISYKDAAVLDAITI